MNSNTLAYENKFSKFCTRAVTVVLGVIFALLTFAAFIQTEYLNIEKAGSEVLEARGDNIFINIALLILFFIIGIICVRKHVKLYRVNPLIIIIIMVTLTTLLTGFWNIYTNLPPISDSNILANSAREFAQDNYSQLLPGPNKYAWKADYYGNYSYYAFYPFQLGYVFIAEMLIRIFGTGTEFFTLKIVNILALDFLYLALVFIVNRLFKNRTVTCMAAIALTLCLQSVFYSVFTYGNILGISFAMWAVYFTVKYMQEGKISQLIVTAVLMIFSVLSKYNNIIAAIAIAIALILHTFDKKKITAVIMAVVIVALPFVSQKLVIKQYELRADVKLDTEMKQIEYLTIGLSEGANPGWYNGNGLRIMLDNNMDQEKCDAAAKEFVFDRLSKLTGDFKYGSNFFINKILTQFNEPSYQSLWLSQARSIHKSEISDFEQSFYTGGMYQVMMFYFNFYSMIIYLGFTLYLLRAFLKNETSPQTAIIPIIIIGAFIYHLLFEGKSQYIFPYFILMIPFAMAGIYYTLKKASVKLAFLFKSANEKNEAK